jgi:hypothetical protein
MITRKLSRTLLEQKPYEGWNAFVNLVATESFDDLDSVQRIAHLCFWYDSEVQNGGHFQYFENHRTIRLYETLAALQELGAEGQRAILERASHSFLAENTVNIDSVDEYLKAESLQKYPKFDMEYYACVPSMQKLLADYFERHRSHFIEIIE